jgi:L-amino acid N-acyltransferase YncA
MRVRLARSANASAIAIIYNQGFEDRVGTFETALRTGTLVAFWPDGIH